MGNPEGLSNPVHGFSADPGKAGMSMRKAASALVEASWSMTVPVAIHPSFPVPGVIERTCLSRKSRARAAYKRFKQLLPVRLRHVDQPNEERPALVAVDGDRCQELVSRQSSGNYWAY